MIKKAVPHIIALLVFIVVSMLYFAPQYEGKAVRQSDNVQSIGMRGGITEHIEKYGEHPQWAPNMFSGMPAYLIDMNYDGRLIKDGSNIFYFLGKPAAYYFIMMAGFYFMLLCFGVNPWLGIIGGLAYGLSSYFYIIFAAGHITKLMALSFIAPMIGAIFLAYSKNLWLGAALAGIFASIEISASHPQITYYFLFVILGLIIAQGYLYFKEKRLPAFFKRSAVLLFSAILAIGSNSIQLWYISDYAKDSIRSKSELTPATPDEAANQTSGLDKDYITAWSYGKMETFNLFIPNLMGGSSSGGFSEDGEVAQSLEKYNAKSIATQLPAYWGPQPFTEGPVYIGAVVVFLFVLGLFLVKGTNKWWLLAVTVFSILLAWGKNMMWFNDLFIHYMPGYNKLRTVSMILVIAEWSMPLLGVLALKQLWDTEGNPDKTSAPQTGVPKDKFNKALKYSLGITGGIALLFILLGGGIFNFMSDNDAAMQLPDDVVSAMIGERETLMRMDALRSFFFVIASAATIWLFYTQKIKKSLFIIILSALVLIDMVPVDKRYLNNDDFMPARKAVEIAPTQADLEILKDKDPNFRVANLSVNPFMDATTSHFHKSVGGYHAAKMRRYQEIIDRYLSKMDLDIYNMLNTKYFIQPGENNELSVIYNDQALGNAWFVNKIQTVNNADEEITELGNIDPSTEAVVDIRFSSELNGISDSLTPDSTATIKLTDYKANHLTYQSRNTQEALAVFSEIYYPKGWKAFIDGQEVPYLRANYILRGLVIPAGEHTIEFTFAAPHFSLLKTITYTSSILLYLMLATGIVLFIRRKKTSQEKN
ncbi:MAG TPA: YfhO family protein [Candidatus Avirikenella pullistercoris]|nr:YfhO family protein [Candidatus Avirikenella pullistercoris]